MKMEQLCYLPFAVSEDLIWETVLFSLTTVVVKSSDPKMCDVWEE